VFKEARKAGIMLKARLAVVSLALALFSSAILQAQTAAAPPAPIPSQILTAKKVFISNAGGDFGHWNWSGGQARTYDEFYAAIKSWGRYELVSTPCDADLVLAIIGHHPVDTGGNDLSTVPQFGLVLIDPKTHIALWTLDENVPQGMGTQKSRDKGFEGAMNKLVADLKALTAQPAATANR
jgi:hypothetical protein